jgi:hypothetical protein
MKGNMLSKMMIHAKKKMFHAAIAFWEEIFDRIIQKIIL